MFNVPELWPAEHFWTYNPQKVCFYIRKVPVKLYVNTNIYTFNKLHLSIALGDTNHRTYFCITFCKLNIIPSSPFIFSLLARHSAKYRRAYSRNSNRLIHTSRLRKIKPTTNLTAREKKQVFVFRINLFWSVLKLFFQCDGHSSPSGRGDPLSWNSWICSLKQRFLTHLQGQN